jgi:hypothetical protein
MKVVVFLFGIYLISSLSFKKLPSVPSVYHVNLIDGTAKYNQIFKNRLNIISLNSGYIFSSEYNWLDYLDGDNFAFLSKRSVTEKIDQLTVRNSLELMNIHLGLRVNTKFSEYLKNFSTVEDSLLHIMKLSEHHVRNSLSVLGLLYCVCFLF